jgi:hypothetical protein
MDERRVKQVVLVRAIETADRARAILSEDDRRIASQGARERLANAASDRVLATQPMPVQFIGMRAELLLQRALRRYPALAKLIDPGRPLALAAVSIPVLAFIVGVAVDRIADPHRVDLLSAPLLGILAWNLVVYSVMLVWLLLPKKPQAGGLAQWLHAGSVRLHHDLQHRLPEGLQAALLSFSIEWRWMSGALDAARIGRMLHLSAALFAAGATLSLYLRGFLTQYAAGWESTFLDPGQLQSILSIVFAPARAVFHLQPFSLADIEALRFTAGTAPAGIGNGARWVHLHAATLLLLVILPRLALAGLAHWRARRLQLNFPLSLAQPYFRQLVSELGGAGGVLQILPYSFALDTARNAGLARIAEMLLGDRARVVVDASTEYGGEAVSTGRVAQSTTDDVAITAVLFNLAATPETQNHGAFLAREQQQTRTAGRQFLVLLDESGYRARHGDQAGGQARVTERIGLWQDFCQQYQLRPTVVDLLAPQRRQLELDMAMDFGGAA